MQFTSVIIFAVTALSVYALPAAHEKPPTEPSSPPAPANVCDSKDTQLCCNSSVELGLSCTLGSVLGNVCSEQTICCQNYGSGSATCNDEGGNTFNILNNVKILDGNSVL